MRDDAVLEKALGRELAAHIRPWMQTLDLKAGDPLLTEGQAAPSLYILVRGELEVRRSGAKDVVLGLLAPGALVGEIGFLDGGPATASLSATTDSHLLHIQHSLLPRLQREAPDLAGRLLVKVSETMAQRLDQSTKTLAELLPQPKRAPRRRDRLRRLFGQIVGAR